MDSKRMEFLFLDHTHHWLVHGAELLMVVQQQQLRSCASLLSAHFDSFRVLRLTDPETERFDQVALFAVRKRISPAAHEEIDGLSQRPSKGCLCLRSPTTLQRLLHANIISPSSSRMLKSVADSSRLGYPRVVNSERPNVCADHCVSSLCVSCLPSSSR